jgi:hypothetical protein
MRYPHALGHSAIWSLPVTRLAMSACGDRERRAGRNDTGSADDG